MPTRPNPEEVFLEHLDRSSPGDPIDVEGLCYAHPSIEAELRRIHADHVRARRLLDRLGETDAEGWRVEGERYEVRGEIASGGMGTVLEVWDRDVGRTLAMKVLSFRADPGPADPIALPRRRSRLINEAQILGQLEHPGIVPMHEIGADAGGSPYFTMQRVQGRDLGEILREAGKGEAIGTRRAWSRSWARVCEAVAHAHERGVVHRDLKPSNVMVGSFGEVYVMDWGLAKARGRPVPDVRIPQGDAPCRTDPLPDRASLGTPASVHTHRPEAAEDATSSDLQTLEGEVVGTPGYMSPEQAEGFLERIDERSDVYSVGAILYHLLAGHPPYDSDSRPARETLAAVRAGELEDVERAAPGEPPELVSICSKAMARDPARRYASMAALASDLRAFLEVRVVRAHRTGPWVELVKWVRRNRAVAGALVGLLLTIVAVAVQQSTAARRQRELNRDLVASVYRTRISMAVQALEKGENAELELHLSSCPPALRGWEWSVLDRLTDTSDRRVLAHPCPWGVWDMSWGPGGLVTCGADGTLAFWDLENMSGEPRLADPPSGPFTLSRSTDGRTLVALSRFHDGRVWDVDSGTALHEIDAALEVSAVALAGDEPRPDHGRRPRSPRRVDAGRAGAGPRRAGARRRGGGAAPLGGRRDAGQHRRRGRQPARLEPGPATDLGARPPGRDGLRGAGRRAHRRPRAQALPLDRPRASGR